MSTVFAASAPRVLRRQERLAIVGVVMATCGAAGAMLYGEIGDEVFDLGILPVAAVAGLFGTRSGLVVGIALSGASAVLQVINGTIDSPWSILTRTLAVLAIAYGFGATRAMVLAWRSQSARLERSEQALRTVVENVPMLLWSVDEHRRFTVREGRALAALGWLNGDHVGDDAHAFYRLHYPDHPELSINLERAFAGEEFTTALTLRGRVLDTHYVPVRDGPRIRGVVCVASDVTDRDQAQHQLRRSEARLDGIVRSAQDAIITVDTSGRIVIFNEAAERMFGYSAETMVGKTIDRLVPEMDRARHSEHVRRYSAMDSAPREMKAGRALRALRANGDSFQIEATLSRAVVDGEVLATVIIRDVTERLRLEAALEHRALHDTLTDLPNRSLLHDRLAQAVSHSRRTEAPFSLLIVDLDNFKDTNDALGHETGDLLLKEVASRLRRVVREVDTVARLGGDEFGILLPEADRSAAVHVAGRILSALAQPWKSEALDVDVSASIGVAFWPEHGEDPTALLRHADVAMYQAKRVRRTFVVYEHDVAEANSDQLALVTDLRAAIERSEIGVVFQPEVDVRDGRVIRLEALARWTHPRLGPIPPDRFIPIAERTGLIGALTRRVTEGALRHLAAWRAEGAGFGLAINLSVRDLADPAIVESISGLLRAYRIPGKRLTVEITETVLMSDVDRLLPTLAALRALGADLAIDDFGTGYSSLAYLRELPVTSVKIDRSFIRNMGSPNGLPIVRAAVELAHQLGLEIVAEGVETAAAMAQLRSIGCDSAQGYHISRPIPAGDVLAWCQANGHSIARDLVRLSA